MSLIAGNLFADLPRPVAGEVFDELLRLDRPRGQLRIERIISSAAPEPTL